MLFTAGSHAWAALPDEEVILKKGGKDAQVLIEKAYDILENAEVFASQAVGYAGSPTRDCWALTVIVRYDSQALKRLAALYEETSQPETKLYAITGLIALDPKQKAKFAPPDFPAKLRDTPVQTMNGCVVDTRKTFGVAVGELEEAGPSAYLYQKLPSIYRATEVRRFKTE
ncbi:MAG: hypothetical protein JWO89_981 [Verrucomicrobiaceae bacterium]|nr:hypothetical protein [Verrucomicrobiaceae bacterium]